MTRAKLDARHVSVKEFPADSAPDEKIRKKPLDSEHGDVVQYGAKR